MLLCLPVPVVFPIHLCPADVVLLAILRPAGEQNNQAVSIPSEVNPVAGTEGNLTFENASADGFDVGEITVRNALERCCHLRGGVNV